MTTPSSDNPAGSIRLASIPEHLTVEVRLGDSLLHVKEVHRAPAKRPGWRRTDDRDDALWMGTRADVDIALADMPCPRVPLVRSHGRNFLLCIAADWTGWVWHADRMQSLAELTASGQTRESDACPGFLEYVIPAHASLVVQCGLLEFRITFEAGSRKLSRGGRVLAPDLGAYLAGSAAVLLCALFVTHHLVDPTPRPPRAPISVARWVRIKAEPVASDTRPRHRRAAARVVSEIADLPAQAIALRDEPAEETPASDQGDPREAARARARQAGIAGLVAQSMLREGVLKKMVDEIEFDRSREAIEQLGTLDPVDLDTAIGGWGHGIRKMGPGSGDGQDWGTIAAKPYSLATSGQRGDDYERKALSKPHAAKSPGIAPAALAAVESGIKYDVIRGQLGLRKGRFRKCFETSESELGSPGQLVVHLQISAAGVVVEARAPAIDEERVRSCIETALLSIRFPEPNDGRPVHIAGFSLRI